MLALAVVAVVALAACHMRDVSPAQVPTTTSGDVQAHAPADPPTSWTTEGGPAEPGVPSTGRIVSDPSASDAGAPR